MKRAKQKIIIVAILCFVMIYNLIPTGIFASVIDKTQILTESSQDDMDDDIFSSDLEDNEIYNSNLEEEVNNEVENSNMVDDIDNITEDIIPISNNVEYTTINNSEAYMTIRESGTYSIDNITTNKPIIIENGVVNLTIENVNIQPLSSPAIWIKAPATLNLKVSGTNNIVGAPGFAGIFVEPSYDVNWNVVAEDSAKLNISGDGIVTAIGGNGDPTNTNLYGGGAGIGGNGQYDERNSGRTDDAVDFGIITVSKEFTGTINATGGSGSGYTSGMFGGGAGIGSGGFNMSGAWDWGDVWGEINIHSGNINVYPTESNDGMGAGIGGGSGYGDITPVSHYTINITGGVINATGGYLSAGIGGGGICDGGTINISGGTIISKGGQIDGSLGGAGIGGGNDAAFTDITITGGNVTAIGTGGSAGIGGGTDTQYSSIFWGDTDGKITPGMNSEISISGLNTVVTAYGGTGYGTTKVYGGAGIGSGYVSVVKKRSVAMDISIKYGATVTAYSGLHAEAIGYGYNSASLKNSDGDTVSYTGYGITLELDDSITLWAVNDDYYKPALVAANEYDGAPVKYGDIKYVSNDIYLTTYTDENIERTGDILNGVAIGQLETNDQIPTGVNISWELIGSEKLMDMDIDVVTNVPEKSLDTPFSKLHGNWATLYPAPIHITYEWVGSIKPSDVTPPTTDFVVKGTEYFAKSQDPTSFDYFFDGWYTDPLCTNKFIDGTEINKHIILYGRWIEGKPEVETGNLKVTKMVTGSGGDKEYNFNFIITLNDSSINGEYGSVIFDNGEAKFTLHNGQDIEITGIPIDVKYEIIEEEANQKGYTTTSNNAKGYVNQNTLTLVTFENNKGEPDIETGWLSITKEVAGDGADENLEFNFTLILDDESINGKYGEIEFTAGKAIFTLRHNERITASDLPVGTHFEVIEEETNDYTSTSNGESGYIIKEGNTAAFINIYNEDITPEDIGNIMVTKIVEGTWGELDREFTINIELNDKSINKTFGDITFVNGGAKFTLKNGESKTATGLPANIRYTITEDEANKDYYKTSYVNNSGLIIKDITINAEIINYRDKKGNLSIRKTVEGPGGDINKEFSFIITLSGKYIDDDGIEQNASELNNTFNNIEFINGVAKFTLKHNETLIINELPATIAYSIVEEETKYYTTTSINERGMILADSTVTTNVEFTNYRGAGNLVVSKFVSGSDGNKSKEFNFTITLDDTSINGKYGDIIFVNGVANFTLKHNESKIAKNLPSGIKYNVVEKETNKNGYSTTISNASGVISNDNTISVKIINHKDKKVPESSNSNSQTTENKEKPQDLEQSVDNTNTELVKTGVEDNTTINPISVVFIILIAVLIVGYIIFIIVYKKRKI